MKEILDEVIEKAIIEQYEKWASDGLTDTQILNVLSQDTINEVFLSLSTKESELTYDFFKSHMFEINMQEKAKEIEFMARLEQDWGDCFAASQTLYTMITESAEQYSEYIHNKHASKDKQKKSYTFLSLQYIHGRACQQYLEILFLIRCGFADGAYARWRSLFELCCTAKFIVTYGERIAKQYFEQSATDDRKFTWTTGVKDKNNNEIKIKAFDTLKKHIEIDPEWEKAYKMGCLVTHGSPQATFTRIASFKNDNRIHIGHSNYGIDLPAIQSAICLVWVTHLFFSIFPTAEFSSRLITFNKWRADITDLYTKAKKEMFEDLEEDTAEESQPSNEEN